FRLANPFSVTLFCVQRDELRNRCEIDSEQRRREMAGSLRLWDGASGRFRGGEPSAKRRCLRSGKVERICLRFGDGPAGHDLVWHSRYPDVRAERSAIFEAVRMKKTCSPTTSVSS